MLALDVPRFTPPRLLQSANAQTLAGILWPRWLRRPRLALRPPSSALRSVVAGEGEGEDRLWAENRAVEFLRSAA